MAVIEAQDVSKSYSGAQALCGFNVQVHEGSIFALLGPNGAGKTTFMKCALGLLMPDSGRLTLGGLPTSDPRSREQLAYLPEKFTFFGLETPTSALLFLGKLRGVGGDLKAQSLRALERAGIPELANRKLKAMSKGQLQRVGIAALLLGGPKLLFLDEPFSGLDPLGIKDLKVLINGLKAEGATVFVNSHILSEMEQICDHFAILNRGRCLAQGPLRQTLAGKSLEDFFDSVVRPVTGENA